VANVVNTQEQAKFIAEWRDEIDTCLARLKGASENATRAVAAFQKFVGGKWIVLRRAVAD
jgi:hypothetical protein